MNATLTKPRSDRIVQSEEEVEYGFTGTSAGMTHAQSSSFVKFIRQHPPGYFHHGDCIGSDAHAHALIRINTEATIIVYPPEDPKARAFCDGDIIRPEKPYLDRNRDIVNESKLLLATPRGIEAASPRSGTWYTVRYARKVHKPVVIFWPDGTVGWEGR